MIFSIHIPKTAGTTLSFYYQNVIKDMSFLYECGKCGCYIMNSKLEEIWENKKCENHLDLDSAKSKILNSNFKLVHGHYKIENFLDIKSDNDSIITWLRDPYKKVISDYFFLQQEREFEDMTLLDEIESFIEIRKNTYRYYLGNINLKDIKFIGIVEDFENDFKYMCDLFNIPFLGIPEKENASKYDSDKLKKFEKMKNYIVSINDDDYEIYNKSKSIKISRL